MNFWNKNKVFILGLLGAIGIVLQDYLNTSSLDWKAVGVAVLMAILSYVAKEWRGQGMTIIGIIGVAANVIVSLQVTGTLTLQNAILSLVVALITASAPDPKSRGYEQTAAIKDAKAEGEAITPAKLTAKPKV